MHIIKSWSPLDANGHAQKLVIIVVFHSLPVVNVGFDPVTYSVEEGRPVVIIIVLIGLSAIDVSVTLNTQDGSAESKIVNIVLDYYQAYSTNKHLPYSLQRLSLALVNHLTKALALNLSLATSQA